MGAKIEDYLAMGVKQVWVFDPGTRSVFRCDEAGYHRITEASMAIDGTMIRLDLAAVFAALER